MSDKNDSFHWIPRIICIIAILLISVFALDSFSPERTVLQNAGAFLMHLIPSFALIAVLIIAWNHEKTGGIILTIIGIAWTIFIFVINYRRVHLVVRSLEIALVLGVPFIIAGILFIISYTRRNLN